MKRTLALLVVCLMLWSGAALADTITIDLETATFAELVNAKKAIEMKLFGLEEYKEVPVPAGTYEIGKDIPAGEYRLVPGTGGVFALSSLVVYDAKGDYKTMHTLTDDNIVGRLLFEEGEKVEISGTPVIFSTYIGLGF